MSPRTGRPPKDNPRSASIHIRVTPDEKKQIMDYCVETGKTCLELLQIAISVDKKE